MKIRRPADIPQPSGGISAPGYDKRREAAIEKQRTPAIPLECKHFTSWEVDELYSFCRPKGYPPKYYCETCGAWRLRLSRKKSRKFPDVPLF